MKKMRRVFVRGRIPYEKTWGRILVAIRQGQFYDLRSFEQRILPVDEYIMCLACGWLLLLRPLQVPVHLVLYIFYLLGLVVSLAAITPLPDEPSPDVGVALGGMGLCVLLPSNSSLKLQPFVRIKCLRFKVNQLKVVVFSPIVHNKTTPRSSIIKST